MVKEIPLTRGEVALVDDEDYDFLIRVKWGLIVAGKQKYARRALVVNGDWFHMSMHRLISCAPEGVQVDHWDGNGLNNQRANLRLCSASQNQANRKHHSHTSFKGVQKSGHRTYQVSIQGAENRINLGCYDTAAEAGRVYDAAAKRLYGEFALGNFPEIDPVADEIAARILAGGPLPDRTHTKKHARKLTDEQVIEIRERYAAGGVLGKDLADEYGVCIAAISHLISGRTFKDVGTPVPTDRRGELRRINHHVKASAA